MGESPTKLAVGEEKKYTQRNEIRAILYTGVVTSDRQEIMEAFVEHYQELLGRSVPMTGDFVNIFLSAIPTLDEPFQKGLEAPVTVEEVEAAIHEVSCGKTPGPYDLCAEFNKGLKEDIAGALHEVIVEAYEKRRLPQWFTEAHTALIPK